MKRMTLLLAGAIFALGTFQPSAKAEILAMINYETKSKASLKALKRAIAAPARKEGIVIMDVDPNSKNFGKIMKDIPLPGDLVAHHIFYNRDSSKAYLTALGKPELRVMDMKAGKFSMKVIPVPDCTAGEDIIFSADNKRWYLSCMGTSAVIVGDAVADKVIRTLKVSKPYTHGIAIHNGIDRILATSTVRHTDLGDAGETITVIEASTGRMLGSHKVSIKKSPSRVAPVEVLFVPRSNPPVAYITNMFGGSLWTATWSPGKKDFEVAKAFDFGPMKMGVTLELYFNPTAERLYVTTAKPGHFHIFDISASPSKPKLLKTIATAEGAHHVAFTKDWRYAFVQNAFLNLPGMSDGSITVIDLKAQKAIRTIDTLKKRGYNPNSIVLLPKWNDLAGH